MNEYIAKSVVASLLALNTVDHLRATMKDNDLEENTQGIFERNYQIAVQLGLHIIYLKKLAIHLQDL